MARTYGNSIISDPIGNGEITINLGHQAGMQWHEIAVQFVDNSGNPVATLASGTASGSVKGVGSDQHEDFSEQLNLSTDDRRWIPFSSMINEVKITFADLPANTLAIVTLNSWRH